MQDPKILVTVYAAIVATIALLWNIVTAIVRSSARLKVQANFGLQFVGDQFGNPLSPDEPTLKVVITNVGPTTRFINRPFFEISRKLDGDNQFETLTPNENFPTRLEPGQVFQKTFNLRSLNTQILQRLQSRDKLRFIVTDSLGKKFKSKKLKISSLTTYYHAINQGRARGS